ncbi:MAG: translocation/assembly module TamB domain-containing protein [Acidobacteriota bacterium]|nr:MAG: translocation/assembly module TamB domain-containing protein [Acidobacteriota bacterium]
MSRNPEENSTPTEPVRRRFGRLRPKLVMKLLLVAVVLIGLLGLGGFLYLRSEKFNQFVAGQIRNKLKEYGLRGEIGDFGLSLTGQTATLRDFRIYNERNGKLLASIGEVRVSFEIREPFAPRLSREVGVTLAEIDGLRLNLETDRQGRSSFEGLRTPPRRIRRLTFDTSKLKGVLKDSSIRYSDLRREIEFELGGIGGTASPTTGDSGMISVQIEGRGGRIERRKQMASIDSLVIDCLVGQTGLKVRNMALDSDFARVSVKGGIETWSPVKYGFDFETRFRAEELTRVFAPEIEISGAAAARGRFEGEKSDYRFNGDATSADLTVFGSRLRDLKFTRLRGAGRGNRFDFICDQISARSTGFDRIEAGPTAITGVKGDLDNLILKTRSSSARIETVEWPESRLSSLALEDITADFDFRSGRFDYEIKTAANLQEGEITGIEFSNARALALFDKSGLGLTEIQAEALGGQAQGTFQLPLGKGAISTATAAYADLRAQDLITLLVNFGQEKATSQVPLAGRVSGQAELTFAGADPRTLNGKIDARFTGTTGESLDAIPVSGDASIAVADGVFQLSDTRFTTGATQLNADGALAIIGDSDLKLRIVSTQAEQLIQIARSIEALRPYVAEYEPQIIGNFRFDGNLRSRTLETDRGEITGFAEHLSIEGGIDAETVGLRDALLGALTGKLFLSNDEIRVSSGMVKASNGGTVGFDLRTAFDPNSTDGRLDAVIDRIELDSILAASGAPDAGQVVTGEITGEIHLTELPGSMRGTALVRLVNGTIANQPADLAMADVRFDGRTAILEELAVRLRESSLSVRGSMNLDDYAFRVEGRAEQVRLSEIVRELSAEDRESPVRVEGTADAEFTVGGRVIPGKQPDIDRENLEIAVTARGRNVLINGRDAGQTALTIRTSPGGRIDFGVTSDILLAAKPSGDAAHPEILRGNIELRKPGIPLVIESDLVNQELSPVLELLAPDAKDLIKGTVSGKLRLEGPTQDAAGNATFEQLRGGLTLTDSELLLAETPVKVNTPVTATFEEMKIGIAPTRFSGDGVDLSVAGDLGLKGEAEMSFSLRGTVDLNKLPLAGPDLNLLGSLDIDASLRGSAEKPILGGKIDIEGFGFSSRDLPFFFSDGKGAIRLDGDQIVLEEFNTDANDGKLKASGAMRLEKLRPKEWNYSIQADNATLNYRDVTATVIGDLRLSGNTEGQTLAGTITIPQAEYAPDIDLDNLLTSGAEISLLGFGLAGGSDGAGGLPPIRLNLRVEANNSLIVRNEQINAVGSALLNVSGILTNPDLTGRVESEGGSVRFRGQRYEISNGTIDLPPGDVTPLLNLVAESEFSGYRVTIGFIGPIDDIDLTLRSEPQLVRDEIIALITTGRTEAGTISARDPLLTGVGTAASLLSSGIISRPTEQLLGLSRFQIDPVIRPNANPAARLTVGQQLSRNVYLSYSTNLATEQDQTALAEYTISNRFSALATYTQGGSSTRQGLRENAFTIELRGRKRFSIGFSPDLSASGAAIDPLDQIANFSRPTLPAAQVQVDDVPDLKLGNKKLRELLPVMTQGFSRSLARLGVQRLREHLQENGYFFAEVDYHCEPVTCSGDDLRLYYDIQPNATYDLKEIRIEGTDIVKVRNLEEQFESKTASRFGGIPFLKDLPLIGGYVRGLTSNDRLRNDSEVIRRTLVDMGYRSADVRARLGVRPDNDDLVVIFDVDEGVQSEVAGVTLRGNSIITAGDLRKAIPIQEGEAFSFSRALAGVQQIRDLYTDLGYLQAGAELTLENVDVNSVQLVYTINEGARAFISEIEINGLTKTGKGWVRRYLDFKQGEILTPDKIRQTQRDLYATNAFREINIRTEPVGGDDGSAQRISVNLTEARPLLLVYGLGYSTDDGVRGLMEIANTNLGGSLDALSLRLRGSRREQFGQLSFTDLRPFGTRLPTTMSVFYNRTNNLVPIFRRRVVDGKEESVRDESFGLNRFAAFIQTERKLGPRSSVRFRYNYERASLFNLENIPETEITRNERVIRLGLFSIGISHDTRDSVLNPTTGQLVSADHSLAANLFGGNESFNKFFGTYQRYHTLSNRVPMLSGTTLAFSARLGLAAVFRDADRNNDGMISESEERLPISERFFSGGATTLRGFRFETAGPQGILEPSQPNELPTLIPLGGDALAIFNFELRYPLSERWRLVPFYDLGNVFRRINDINFSNMTHTVGLGIRINTPLGPVGIDYGFLIDPPAYPFGNATLRQPRGAFHIRLGQTF